LDVAPLQSGTKNHFIRILADEVTGRRFPVTDPSDWETDLSHVARAPREQSSGPRASSRADPARAVGQVSREWLGRHREQSGRYHASGWVDTASGRRDSRTDR